MCICRGIIWRIQVKMHSWLGWNTLCVAQLLDWKEWDVSFMLNCILGKYKYIRKTIQLTKFWARNGEVTDMYFLEIDIFFLRSSHFLSCYSSTHPPVAPVNIHAPNLFLLHTWPFSLWFPLAISRGECGSWTALIKRPVWSKSRLLHVEHVQSLKA